MKQRRPRKRKLPADRFWELVDRGSKDECWRFTGALAANTGYGVFNSGERSRLAHIYVYELTRPGVSRRGLVVRHTCDHPWCVNPHHLRLGTYKHNSRDMDERGRRVNNPVRGEAHYSAKLVAWQVQEARKLYACGPPWTIVNLAQRYNVSVTSMSAAIKGRTWKHV